MRSDYSAEIIANHAFMRTDAKPAFTKLLLEIHKAADAGKWSVEVKELSDDFRRAVEHIGYDTYTSETAPVTRISW